MKKIIAIVVPSLVVGILIGVLVGMKIPKNETSEKTSTEPAESQNVVSETNDKAESNGEGLITDEIAEISIDLHDQIAKDSEKYNFWNFTIGVPLSSDSKRPDNAEYVASTWCPQSGQRGTYLSDSGGRQYIDIIVSFLNSMEHIGTEDEYGMIEYDQEYIATITVYEKGKGRPASGTERYYLTQPEFEVLYSQLSEFVDNIPAPEPKEEIIILQYYSNMDYTDAVSSLEALGLNVVLATESNPEFEKNKVIRTEPSEGSYVSAGETITVYYSN